MMLARKHAWVAVGLVALVQSAVLGYMVWDRASLLRNGRQITLPIVPVDPRSLFRGDYVILGYDIGQVEIPAELRPLPQGAVIYVTIASQPDGSWKVARVARRHTPATGPDEAVLKGRLTYAIDQRGMNARASVRYGIESYFVPEGTGRPIEDMVQAKKMQAIVAVGRDGRAAIAGLAVEGKPLVIEPRL